jgi:hypothetical protein
LGQRAQFGSDQPDDGAAGLSERLGVLPVGAALLKFMKLNRVTLSILVLGCSLAAAAAQTNSLQLPPTDNTNTINLASDSIALIAPCLALKH